MDGDAGFLFDEHIDIPKRTERDFAVVLLGPKHTQYLEREREKERKGGRGRWRWR